MNLGIKILKSEDEKIEFKEAFNRNKYWNALIGINKTGLRITTGTPESGNYSTDYINKYSITNHFLWILFDQLENLPNNSNIWHSLVEWNLLPKNLNEKLNPLGTILGHVIKRCFQIILESEQDFDYSTSLKKIKINKESISPIIGDIFELEQERKVEVDYYYFFFGVNFHGKDTSYDEISNQMMYIPDVYS